MLAGQYMPDDDVCPVRDELLGELYCASKLGLATLIATVPPTTRAMLALFCYHRSHLHSMALAIAASCHEDDLVRLGGRVGSTLYSRAQEAPPPAPLASHNANRRKITLASGQLRQMAPLVDEPDDEIEEPATEAAI
ncbi:MAG TPA: hypothetical protein VGI22_15340 [Xanthobacteraceae bacterium]|jgi:hypothetical protein